MEEQTVLVEKRPLEKKLLLFIVKPMMGKFKENNGYHRVHFLALSLSFFLFLFPAL